MSLQYPQHDAVGNPNALFRRVITTVPRRDVEKLKDALWQYLVEHSKSNGDGSRYVAFVVKSKKSFFGRLAARMHGYRARPEDYFLNK